MTITDLHHIAVRKLAGTRGYRIALDEDERRETNWRLMILDMESMTGEHAGIGDSFDEAMDCLARNMGRG
jgi:hypothetical protein